MARKTGTGFQSEDGVHLFSSPTTLSEDKPSYKPFGLCPRIIRFVQRILALRLC